MEQIRQHKGQHRHRRAGEKARRQQTPGDEGGEQSHQGENQGVKTGNGTRQQLVRQHPHAQGEHRAAEGGLIGGGNGRQQGIDKGNHPQQCDVLEHRALNQQAQNALLKTIEEPPAYAIIMLLTTNADTFLPTILSRCVTLNIKVVPDEKIKKFLMEKYQIPDYQADVCVAFAQGNVGKAIQLASSDDFNEMKASALQLIKRLDDIDLYEMTAAVKQIADYKLEINDYFDLMMIWYRDILYFKATKDVNGLIFRDEVYDIKRQAEKSSYNGINEILEALRKARIRLEANVNFDLVIELLLLTIKEN